MCTSTRVLLSVLSTVMEQDVEKTMLRRCRLETSMEPPLRLRFPLRNEKHFGYLDKIRILSHFGYFVGTLCRKMTVGLASSPEGARGDRFADTKALDASEYQRHTTDTDLGFALNKNILEVLSGQVAHAESLIFNARVAYPSSQARRDHFTDTKTLDASEKQRHTTDTDLGFALNKNILEVLSGQVARAEKLDSNIDTRGVLKKQKADAEVEFLHLPPQEKSRRNAALSLALKTPRTIRTSTPPMGPSRRTS